MTNFLLSYKEKKQTPLLLDGAIGSLLQTGGIENHPVLWTSKAVLENPELLYDIHSSYIEAGADIITTNTFRSNTYAVLLSGEKVESNLLTKESVSLAVSAAKENKVLVAGSNGPSEDCYTTNRTLSRHDLEKDHSEHITVLYENGCDFILNETMGHLDEIEFVCLFCSNNNIPFVVSLFFDENLLLLDGTELAFAVNKIKDSGTMAIGFNCIKPETLSKVVKPLFPWGFYMNCGSGSYTDENISCGISPAEYSNDSAKMIDSNTLFVGACCGSGYGHIKSLRRLLDGVFKA